MTPADIKPGMRVRVTTKTLCYEGTVLGLPYGSAPWVQVRSPFKTTPIRCVALRCISPAGVANPLFPEPARVAGQVASPA